MVFSSLIRGAALIPQAIQGQLANYPKHLVIWQAFVPKRVVLESLTVSLRGLKMPFVESNHKVWLQYCLGMSPRKGPVSCLFLIQRENFSPIVFIWARDTPWTSIQVCQGPNSSPDGEAGWCLSNYGYHTLSSKHLPPSPPGVNISRNQGQFRFSCTT